MPIVRGQFGEYLAPGARNVFVDQYQELPAHYPQALQVDTSGRAFEEDLVSTGLPIAVRKPEGEEIPFDRPKFRGKVRYIHTTYGLGYEITRETVEDDLYAAVTRKGSTNLARSLREAEEVTAWAIFNGAFTDITAYDGEPLISNTHEGVGGLTFSNRPDPHVDFSTTALQAALEHFMTLETDRGMKIKKMPNTLWVAPQNWIAALEILKAEFRPSAQGGSMGEETPNVVATEAGITPKWSPYLTDPDAWFLTDSRDPMGGKFYWRRKPDPVNGTDERAGVAWFGITGRWSAGTTGWRWIYGSTGA